jgi:hypothetical protein
MFIPDDSRLRGWAYRIAETRRHSLRRRSEDRSGLDGEVVDDPAELDASRDPAGRDGEQLSLFSVISAVATGTTGHPTDAGVTAGEGHVEAGDWGAEIELPALDAPPGAPVGTAYGAAAATVPPGAPAAPRTRREQKNRLRNANADMARLLARKTGWTHAQVNSELNRLAGVRRVTEATLEQLERRLRQAEHWYSKL